MRIALIITGVFLGITVIAIGLRYLDLVGQVATLPANLASKTLQTDNVLQNYEWFKQQFQDIQAITKKADNAQTAVFQFGAINGNTSTWSFEQQEQYNRLNTILLGLQNQRADMISEYNARSQMLDRNIFKTNDLPDHIEQ